MNTSWRRIRLSNLLSNGGTNLAYIVNTNLSQCETWPIFCGQSDVLFQGGEAGAGSNVAPAKPSSSRARSRNAINPAALPIVVMAMNWLRSRAQPRSREAGSFYGTERHRGEVSCSTSAGGPQIGVFAPERRNCPIFGGWRHQFEMRFCHVNCPSAHSYCGVVAIRLRVTGRGGSRA
jgi:hypothetical protein